MSKTVVYVIGSDEFRYVKIGVTTDIEKRLAALATANPHVLIVRGTRPQTLWPDLEKAAHERLVDRRVGMGREWFDIDWRAALSLLDELTEDIERNRTEYHRQREERALQCGGMIIDGQVVEYPGYRYHPVGACLRAGVPPIPQSKLKALAEELTSQMTEGRDYRRERRRLWSISEFGIRQIQKAWYGDEELRNRYMTEKQKEKWPHPNNPPRLRYSKALREALKRAAPFSTTTEPTP